MEDVTSEPDQYKEVLVWLVGGDDIANDVHVESVFNRGVVNRHKKVSGELPSYQEKYEKWTQAEQTLFNRMGKTSGIFGAYSKLGYTYPKGMAI